MLPVVLTPRRAAAVGAAVGLAFLVASPAAASPAPAKPVATERPAAVPSDTTTALGWARRVIGVREDVAAAEAELDPIARATAAASAFRNARALVTSPGARSDRAIRDLVLRAQALYEVHHGPADALDLAPDELAMLRGEALALAAAGDLATVDRVAQATAAAAHAARLAEVARRAEGPAHLFYPVGSEAIVEAQADVVRRRFTRLTRRTRRHFPAIEQTLRRRGLPTDLKYVAVIESALDPEAVSHAGAEGMWQFMPDTQADYGLDSLTVRDPAASTDAAARYLRSLGRMFKGDWQLALAAYNCGPGRVQRIARAYTAETGERATFWAIRDRLPQETQDYVPRFIAVAHALGRR